MKYEEALKILKEDIHGTMIDSVPEIFFNDKSFYVEALNNHALSAFYKTTKFKNDKNLFLLLLDKLKVWTPFLIIPKNHIFRNDRDIGLKAATYHNNLSMLNIFKFIGKKHSKDKEIVTLVIKNCATSYQYVHPILRGDIDIILLAFKDPDNEKRNKPYLPSNLRSLVGKNSVYHYFYNIKFHDELSKEPIQLSSKTTKHKI